ncbi:2-nitropropane dioxygenase family oxidoreductase [Hyaloraphidium curvatum]|nr:2-nitropropane dioxygenase family oxidoreductase [Hyaloraphidium curvatum]
MAKLKKNGVLVMGTATNATEAVALEKQGCDAIIAQGAEAGGHRGTHVSSAPGSGLVGAFALVPSIVDSVSVPVVAAGGIADGRGIVAAMALGAQAVSVGTLFLTCKESGCPQFHRRALAESKPEDSEITRAYTGRNARGLRNRIMEEMGAVEKLLPKGYVSRSRDVFAEAAKLERGDLFPLWTGQMGYKAAASAGKSAGDIVQDLMKQADELLASFCK